MARLFTLQIVRAGYYKALAHDQHQLYQQLFPQRGKIFMQDFSANKKGYSLLRAPLAINRSFYQVYLAPKNIDQPKKEEIANDLSHLLDLKKEEIIKKIEKEGDPYEPLKHKIEEAVAKEIIEKQFEGVGIAEEMWRYYPHESLACHLTGFVGIRENGKIGQYGLEGYYEDLLKGEAGSLTGGKDTFGDWIPSLNEEFEPAKDGSDLVLAVDQNIQFKAEEELKRAIEEQGAEDGTVIVLEPETGAIMALANKNIFNPNAYHEVESIGVFLNKAVQEAYEPGSVMKPITMAAGIDSGKISQHTTYIDEGQVNLRGGVIRNVDGKAYGEQTMTQVLEKSLNTGAVFVQQKMGADISKNYLEKFGFGEPSGVDLAGEAGGNMSNLLTGREIDLATISFGQGNTVTPLSLAAAFGAIANEGKLMRPHVVEKIIHSDNNEEVVQPEIKEQVVSSETAHQLTQMLVSVVDNGFGRPAKVEGYDIAGKTGTAQKPDLEKGGYGEGTIHTFVGFAPAFDPKFVILVKLDNPQGARFAADSVSPVFKRMAEYLFDYLEIPPVR